MSLPVELFRFRVVRPVDARDPANVIDLTGVKASAPSLTYHSATTLIDPDAWSHWLRKLSAQLAARGDLVEPEDVVSLLPADWEREVADSGWSTIHLELAESLLAALQGGVGRDTASKAEKLMRLLRVHTLVTELADDRSLADDERSVRSREDVLSILRRPVVVPGSSIKHAGTQQLVRRPGITDLYLVKDEWNRYEPDQLARVVNVLPGETLESKLRHFERTEKVASTSTETATATEVDQSQTQSSSLSQASTKDASLNVGVQGQVETSGQYGPTHVSTSLGAQLQASMSSSENHALTTAFQTVQRSVKSVSETVLQIQTTRTTVSDETIDDHKLENDGADVTVGLYRWLKEIHRVQVERYPNRFVTEFELPEPGAWLRWAMDNAPQQYDNPDPGPFRVAGASHDLTPTDIDEDSLAAIAAQWRVQGLTPPPPDTITVSVKLSIDPSQQQSAAFATMTDSSLTVPTGYVAKGWSAQAFSVRDWQWDQYGTMLTLIVGGGANGMGSTGDLGDGAFVMQGISGDVGEINTGTIPVTAYSVAIQGFTCVVNVTCSLMPEAYRQWQETTFDTVVSAYEAMLDAYHQEKAAAAQASGGISGISGPPELNRSRVTNELRRLVIEELLGHRFQGTQAIDVDTSSTPPDEPSVDLNETRTVAPLVQFMEQAFEWENLVFICYPYYWSRRAVWTANALTLSADPEFDQFLNAGSARVVVPARPGFEGLVNFFLHTGLLWGGGDPPAPDDPGYLSIAQEIEAIEVGARDGTPVGSSWEIALPTTLIWAGTDPATLPVNQDATIGPPTP